MKPVFMSNDGKTTFDTPAECDAFDKAMSIKSVVEVWAANAYGSKQGQTTNAVNKIMAWEQVRDVMLAKAEAESGSEEVAIQEAA